MPSVFNPEMLTLAREFRGLTQSALAESLGIDQGKLSRMEKGTRIPTETDIQSFSATLSLKPEFFFREGIIKGPEVAEIFHRKRRSVGAQTLTRVHAHLNLVRLDIVELLKIATPKSEYRIPKYLPEKYEYDYELIAALVRQSWRLPLGPIRNMVASLEAAGVFVAEVDFGTDEIDAISQWQEPTNPIIIINKNAPGDRLRFSLAHELGHLVMHHSQPFLEGDIEDQANSFASAFLMPRDEIALEIGNVSIERLAFLKPYWQVSIQALLMRARDVGLVTETRFKSIYQTLSRMGYVRREPGYIEREKATMIWRFIKFCEMGKKMSLEKLAVPLGYHPQEFVDIYQPENLSAPGFRLVEKQDDQPKSKVISVDKDLYRSRKSSSS